MSEMIKVGMADLKLCKAPDAITTLGLGSCVGIAIRDPITKIGGLAHIMLPDSTQFANNTNIPKYYHQNQPMRQILGHLQNHLEVLIMEVLLMVEQLLNQEIKLQEVEKSIVTQVKVSGLIKTETNQDLANKEN